MRVSIYHINKARDVNGKLYSIYQNGDVVDPSIYDEVFSAELDTSNLEEIHRMMKFEGHPLMRGVNVTVSDVVTVNGRAHICQPRGFEEIDFDVSKTQKPDNLMRVVYVEPNKPAYVADVENSLEGEQKAVGGNIEIYENEDDTLIIANRDSKLNGMEGNRRFGDGSSIIAGPFFVCGSDGDEFRSLNDEEVEKYMDKFAEPDQISQDEVKADMGCSFIPM